MRIIDLLARQLLDSRGHPTVEVELYTEDCIGSALVPSGASTGDHEAIELRDEGRAYDGKGVQKAVENINTTIKQALDEADVKDQEAIDTTLCELDGTDNKSNLGANATLAVSLAASRAASAAYEMPLYAYLAKVSEQEFEHFTLPIPFANVINGGVHAGNDLKPQEFMIAPTGADTFEEAVQIVVETYHALKKVIEETHGLSATGVGDEGGFAPPIASARDALELMTRAAKKAGHDKKLSFALDPAASEFYDGERYEVEPKKKLSSTELAAYWLELITEYPIISLEDPFAQDDYDGWEAFMKLLDEQDLTIRPQIVGDDLTVTNPERIKEAQERGLCDSLLLKVNQIGTLTQALQAATQARTGGWSVMVSHRSGETEDPYIADLAVGLGCGQIKLGAPCRGERTAKYNQLLRIAQEVGEYGVYAKLKNK